MYLTSCSPGEASNQNGSSSPHIISTGREKKKKATQSPELAPGEVQKMRLHSGASNGLRRPSNCSVKAVLRLRPRLLLPLAAAAWRVSSSVASSLAWALTRPPARHKASAQAASSSQGGSSKGRFLEPGTAMGSECVVESAVCSVVRSACCRGEKSTMTHL
ncbi:hypothetical protein BKA81DRAFT_368021 [Phyllosticta paracitricarpa]